MRADNMRFLADKYVGTLTIVLVAQAALFYSASRGERIPTARPLDGFPERIGDWRLVQRGVIEPEVRNVLRADDAITRLYSGPLAPTSVNLFVAFFNSQRTGQAPHSPKNCLPGAGWLPSSSGFVDVNVAGESQPFSINRYDGFEGWRRRASCSTATNRAIVWWRANSRPGGRLNPLSPQRYGIGAHLEPGGWK